MQEFHTFISSDDFQYLQAFSKEFESLKEKVAAPATTNNTNLDTFAERERLWYIERADLKQKLGEEERRRVSHLNKIDAAERELGDEKTRSDGLRHRIAELDGQVLSQIEANKKKDLQIIQLRNAREKEAADLKVEKMNSESLKEELKTARSQLDESSKELRTANAALGTIQSFLVNLAPLRDSTTQVYAIPPLPHLIYFPLTRLTLQQQRSSLGRDVPRGIKFLSVSPVLRCRRRAFGLWRC